MGAYDRELQPLVVTPKHQFRQHFGRSVRSLAMMILPCVWCVGVRVRVRMRASVRVCVRTCASK